MKKKKNYHKKTKLELSIEKMIDTMADASPEEVKDSINNVEKLYKLKLDADKIELAEKRLKLDRNRLRADTTTKVLQVVGVPIGGISALLFYRILMETETTPDIFFRDIGKTILTLTGFKKV